MTRERLEELQALVEGMVYGKLVDAGSRRELAHRLSGVIAEGTERVLRQYVRDPRLRHEDLKRKD